MWRDIALGWLTWLLMVVAFIGTCCACVALWGPPTGDRARTFAFIAGGGGMFVATIIVAAVATFTFAE
jgi:hypothetical protein